METNPVEVGQDLNEDISKIFKGNKQTKVHQLLWGSQKKLIETGLERYEVESFHDLIDS